MKLPSRFSVGVCSHTGLMRGANEDDYLLATPAGESGAFMAAIADGMGGAVGGAEASRTALRALGATLLDEAVEPSATARMQLGFQVANARVHESAIAVPALRDMGTTMTAVWLHSAQGVVGHIGDSRLYRVRAGDCQALTTDHAAKQGQSLLTRCIGAGQVHCDAEDAVVEVAGGDRFVLCTDGVWNVVPEQEFAQIVADHTAQEAAERLVKRALDFGGPDNATAVIGDVLAPKVGGSYEADLPRHERPDARSLWPAPVSLRPSSWSLLVLVLAVFLLTYSGLRLLGIDLVQWWRGWSST